MLVRQLTASTSDPPARLTWITRFDVRLRGWRLIPCLLGVVFVARSDALLRNLRVRLEIGPVLAFFLGGAALFFLGTTGLRRWRQLLPVRSGADPASASSPAPPTPWAIRLWRVGIGFSCLVAVAVSSQRLITLRQDDLAGALWIVASAFWPVVFADPRGLSGVARAVRRAVHAHVWEIVALVGLVAWAIYLRFPTLTFYPAGTGYDEIDAGINALKVITGKEHFHGWSEMGLGKPMSFIYLQAVSLKLFGIGQNQLHYAPLVLNVIAIVLFYVLTRQILGRTAALATSALFTISHWNLSSAFYACEDSMPLPLAFASLICLVAAFRDKPPAWRLGMFAASGVLLGWCLSSYSSSRLFAPAEVFFAVALAAADLRRWRQHLLGGLVMGFSTFVGVSPVIWDMLHKQTRHAVFDRVGMLWIGPVIQQQHSLEPLWNNIRMTLLLFSRVGDEHGLRNTSLAPELDHWLAVFAMVGLLIALVTIWRPQSLLAVGVFLTALACSFLSLIYNTGQAERALFALPASLWFAGLGFVGIVEAVRCSLPTRLAPRLAPWTGVILIPIVIVSSMENYRVFFIQGPKEPNVYYAFDTIPSNAARVACDAGRRGDHVYVDSIFYNRSAFAYYCYFQTTTHLTTPGDLAPVIHDSRPVFFVTADVSITIQSFFRRYYPRVAVHIPTDPWGREMFLWAEASAADVRLAHAAMEQDAGTGLRAVMHAKDTPPDQLTKATSYYLLGSSWGDPGGFTVDYSGSSSRRARECTRSA